MMRSTPRMIMLVLGVAAVIVAGAVLWHGRSHRHTFYTDADTIREREEQARVRDVLWKPAERLPGILNTIDDEFEPRITADGTSLFIVRGRPGGNADIYVARRTPRGWTEPTPLAAVNTAADELGPETSADGQRLYFHSDRAGGLGGYDLWMATRTGDGWSTPVNLGEAVNTAYHDYGAATTPADDVLYFSSNRPRAAAADELAPSDESGAAEASSPLAVREDMEQRDYDLYAAPLDGAVAAPARPIAALNTDGDEVAPAVSPGGDFLYFSSNRQGGLGGFDIYRARRLRGEHQAAANLGPSLNTPASEMDPTVGLGGFGLYFASDRADEGRGEAPRDDLDLYFAASREVFTETQVVRAAIDWLAISSAVWPLLLWLLLIALLWASLLKLRDQSKLGRLSLLAKCLLVSLLVHALLMALFTVMEVTTSLSELIRDRSGTRIALVSPSASAAGDVAAQIRGSLTDVQVQVSQESASQRQDAAVEPQPAEAMATLTVQRSTIESRLEPPRPAAADDAPAPATSRQVQTPAVETPPTQVAVETPAQPQPTRAAEATMRARAEATSANQAESAASQATQQATRSAEAAVELAVRPAELAADATLNQRLHDAGQTTDAPSAPRNAMVEAAPAQPVESSVPTIDLALPSAQDAPRERSAEAPMTIAAEAAATPRQRSSAARRAVSSASVNLSPQPLDRPLAQGSTTIADMAPAAAAATPSTTDHRRGETTLIVQPSPAPAMATLPEAAPVSSGEVTNDSRAVASAASPRRARDASPTGLASPEVALEASRPVPAAALSGGSLSRAAASESSAPSSATAAADTPARLDTPAAAALALSLPGAADASAGGATDEPTPATPTGGPTGRSTLAREAIASEQAAANPQVDLGPVDRAASRAPSKSLAADLPAAADARTQRQASAGPNRPAVPVESLAGALDLAMPAGPPQIDERRTPSPRGGAEGAAHALRSRPASPQLASSTGLQTVDLAPNSTAPPVLGPLVAAARSVSADGAARRGSAGFEARGVELTLASALETELPELEESVVAGPGERGRAEPPLSLEGLHATRARGESGFGVAARRSLLPPEVIEPEPTPARVQPRVLADPGVAETLDAQAVLGRPELARAPAVEPIIASLDLHLPRQVAPTPRPYEHRAPEKRQKLVEKGGGSRETEQAVSLALQWLARHQSPDGHWSSRYFDRECGACEGPARVEADIALTGLSLLCFLAADHSPSAPGPYQELVANGIEYLLGRQGAGGDLLGDESMYSHGIATMALAEAYGMTRDARLAGPVRAAVDFIYEARNRRLGGWRYDPGQVGDTSVLGWQVMAIKSAERAGLDVPTAAYEVAEKWLQRVSDPWRPGLYAYQPKRRVTHPMTAEAMFVRQLLGVSPEDPTMQEASSFLLEMPPSWKDGANTYYWYYGTLALYQHGGMAWDRWNESMKRELLDHQQRTGPTAGSWNPEGKWANVGGRVYQTALCTLTLEVYYRYLPLYLTERE